jgi:hypothetical protein
MDALLDAMLVVDPAPPVAPAPAAAPAPVAAPVVAAIAPAAIAPAAVAAAPGMPAIILAAAQPALAAILPVETIGCKLDVWKGTATRTKGGLRRQHLMLNRVGSVVSIKASNAARQKNNLGNYQFPINP